MFAIHIPDAAVFFLGVHIMDKITVFNSLLHGFGQNMIIFAVTLVAAIPLGLLITLGTMSKFKPLRYLMKVYVWIIRGTPLMLQLCVIFYAPGILWGWNVSSRITTAIIAFIINYSAYFSEIFRGGIESIPQGQYEAGQVLGMTRVQIFFKVVLMQVVKRIIAPMSNEIMTLVKDTSLANTISVIELIMAAQRFTKKGLIWPLFSTALFFLAMCGIFTLLLNYAEKKMNYYKG